MVIAIICCSIITEMMKRTGYIVKNAYSGLSYFNISLLQQNYLSKFDCVSFYHIYKKSNFFFKQKSPMFERGISVPFCINMLYYDMMHHCSLNCFIKLHCGSKKFLHKRQTAT